MRKQIYFRICCFNHQSPMRHNIGRNILKFVILLVLFLSVCFAAFTALLGNASCITPAVNCNRRGLEVQQWQKGDTELLPCTLSFSLAEIHIFFYVFWISIIPCYPGCRTCVFKEVFLFILCINSFFVCRINSVIR